MSRDRVYLDKDVLYALLADIEFIDQADLAYGLGNETMHMMMLSFIKCLETMFMRMCDGDCKVSDAGNGKLLMDLGHRKYEFGLKRGEGNSSDAFDNFVAGMAGKFSYEELHLH